MKKICTRLAAGILMLAFTHSYAGDNYWKTFEGKTAPSRLPMVVTPKEYNIFTLDQNAMRGFLFKLSTKFEEGRTIQLPTPDRKYRSFHVWMTPMMEPALAAQYPHIQTFTAVAEDDPNVTAKLDYTPYGFRAMVYDGEKTYLVDPYSDEPDGYYIAFYKSDFWNVSKAHGCGVGAFGDPTTPPDPSAGTTEGGVTAARTNGSVRRTYRLALSCTGEYAINAVGVGATKAQTFGKMIATINRVNGIYERELAVSLKLIATNQDIIYVNPATDPYNCNTSLPCLIGEAQTNITNVVGAANFDIGHILCTAGGGLAQLQAVCGGGKASGTSTSAGPDDFGIILHEMGHQFGANHTFSAGTGGCQGNGNEDTGYEPGSGSTIMSYGGLCDPNNIQSSSDDYFHIHSLREMTDYITTGTGSSCGTTTTGITPVNLPAVVDSFIIPKKTPFELIAPMATVTQNGASVTYCWEQYDLGNWEGTEAQAGNAPDGPIVRSYPPTPLKMRSYPAFDRIISGLYGDGGGAEGQRLPNAVRDLKFKVTARSIFQGWGTFNYIDSVVRLKVSGAGPFRVTSQAGAESWTPHEKKRVEWTVAGTDGDPMNCKWVNIYLSLDSGRTFPVLLVSDAPNSGAYDVTVPDVYTTQGRVKVKGSGNVFFDVNKAAITINGNPSSIKDTELGDALTIYPNPATDQLRIQTKKQYGNDLKVIIYNALGQRVWSGELRNNINIPVASFSRGNYLVQVIDGANGAKTTRKVVLQ
jgi:hypothetical protein